MMMPAAGMLAASVIVFAVTIGVFLESHRRRKPYRTALKAVLVVAVVGLAVSLALAECGIASPEWQGPGGFLKALADSGVFMAVLAALAFASDACLVAGDLGLQPGWLS